MYALLTAVNVLLFAAWVLALRSLRLPWRSVLAMLPTPMLGFASSYGVYAFNRHFAPAWVAIIMAAAYEVTYVGIAAYSALSTSQVRKGDKIARDAAVISFCQNALAGLVVIQPTVLLYSTWGAWALAVNAPLSMLHAAQVWIAYRAANFTLHKSGEVGEIPANSHNVATIATEVATSVRVVGRPPQRRTRPQVATLAPAATMPMLTDKHAPEVVTLRDAGLSFAKIGERLGMSGEAARQKYYAAKATIDQEAQ